MADKVGVHQSHCCWKHGCKYGDDDCPVELGTVKQDHLCEYCENDVMEKGSGIYGFQHATSRTITIVTAYTDEEAYYLAKEKLKKRFDIEVKDNEELDIFIHTNSSNSHVIYCERIPSYHEREEK